MPTSSEQYEALVLKKLEKFKGARDWSDFLEPLDSLCSVFKNNKNGKIPCIPQLVKRLNQLLNHALPGGIHMKTIECYHSILDHINQKDLRREFDALTLGLFNFSFHCRILVANEYLNLLEKIIIKLGEDVEEFSKNIVMGILPFLESESSEFYNRAYQLMISFLDKISQKTFYNALWRNFIDYPDLKVSIINFMNNYKLVVVTNYSLVTNALCSGLNDENFYVIRSMLEISNRDFPRVIEAVKEASEPEETTEMFNSEERSNFRRLYSESTSSLSNMSLSNKQGNSLEYINSNVLNKKPETPKQPPNGLNPGIMDTLKIKGLPSEEPENSTEIDNCNTRLLHYILKIFLMKEMSINKRAYKWLNLGDKILDKDVDYIEKGLRTYLNGTEQDLLIFLRIANSLAYKENLIGFLIDRLVIDALRHTMAANEKKDLDCYVNIKKNMKIFLNHSLDDFYRVMYINLAQKLEDYKEFKDEKNEYIDKDIPIDFSSENISSEVDKTNENTIEELLEIIIYSIQCLDAINQNAITIHIPLICHLLVRNKKKITHKLFKEFFDIFINKSEQTSTYETREIPESLIHTFYQRINCNELLELNLIGAVAKEMSKCSIFYENAVDLMQWSNSNLIEQNGVIMWTKTNDLTNFKRHTGQFFNFYEKDIELLQIFILKFGFKDFNNYFLQELGRFLCFNYKYIELIKQLSFYTNKEILYVTMWNDFIITKNAKFFHFFPEDELLPVIHTVFPTVTLNDMCLFLTEGLEHQRFIDILFRVTTVIDTSSSSFISLIMSLSDFNPLLKYIFNKFFIETADSYEFNIVTSILHILRVMIECDAFRKVTGNNEKVYLEKFGEITMIEAVSKMLISIITIYSQNENIQGFEKTLRKYSAIIDLEIDKVDESSQKNMKMKLENNDDHSLPKNDLKSAFESNAQEAYENPEESCENVIDHKKKDLTLAESQSKLEKSNLDLEKMINETRLDTEILKENKISKNNTTKLVSKDVFNHHPVVAYEIGISNSFCLMEKNSIHLRRETICKIGFDCLYKMHLREISIFITDIDELKAVICENKQDFYILKRSLFLVENDFEFIYNNYMHFYKLILAEIVKMPIKVAFFTYLSDIKTKCTVDVFLEAIPYFLKMSFFKMEDLYLKAQALLTERSRNGGFLYKKYSSKYKRLVHKKNIEERNDYKETPFKLKSSYTEDEIHELIGYHTSLAPVVMLATDNLNSVVELAELMYRMNPNLFISTIYQGADSLFFFSLLPFKLEVLRKLIILSKNNKFPMKIVTLFLTNIQYEKRTDILKLEAEFIKNSFCFGDQDYNSQEFIIEIFKNQPASDLSKMILLHLLNQYESRIDYVVKNNINFDYEVGVLKKLVKFSFKDSAVITAFKNCLFCLLNSKFYREKALFIIYSYLLKYPNCKIFIDQYMVYFNKSFFSFGLILKKKIFEIISASSYFDPFQAIDSAFSGMDTSFFMSAQSEELLKIYSLKKMSFLLLSQPKNKYATMADNFVCLINNLLNSNSDIKFELIRLCSILIFKTNNNYLQTLYPILVEEFMTIIHSKDSKVLCEVFKFIDLSIWLNSSVFDFKVLYLENHNFREKLTKQLFTSEYQEKVIDMNTSKLPTLIVKAFDNFNDWSSFSCFINKLPEYYKEKEILMIENDYEAVEAALTNSFQDLK